MCRTYPTLKERPRPEGPRSSYMAKKVMVIDRQKRPNRLPRRAYDPSSGLFAEKKRRFTAAYLKIFWRLLVRNGGEDNSLMAITPAISEGSGMVEFP